MIKCDKMSRLTQELCQPVGLVVVLHGHGARVEEHEDDHEPEPGWGLKMGRKVRWEINLAEHIL